MTNPFIRSDESNDFYRDPRKPDKDYHFTSDVDSSTIAKHHTLGVRRNQASPGNHLHRDGDGSLWMPQIIIGRTTDDTETLNSASATLVEITKASFPSVSLVAGRVYAYYFHLYMSYNADTSAAGARAVLDLRKTNTGGTLLTTMFYHRNTSLQTNDTVEGRLVWVADATETIPLSFSFARSAGAATFTVQAAANSFHAYIAELSPASKWTVT